MKTLRKEFESVVQRMHQPSRETDENVNQRTLRQNLVSNLGIMAYFLS